MTITIEDNATKIAKSARSDKSSANFLSHQERAAMVAR